MNADRNQQEQLQEKNEASTQQMEQQMRQSPGSVTQQQIDNKVTLLCFSNIDVSVALAVCLTTWSLDLWVMALTRGESVVCSCIDGNAVIMMFL